MRVAEARPDSILEPSGVESLNLRADLPLHARTVARLSTAYRDEGLSPVDVAEACRVVQERLESRLHAFIHHDAEGTRRRARKAEHRWWRWTPLTMTFNLTGQPAISVSCGRSSDGLPIGLQISGPRNRDDLVLRAAFAYQMNGSWPQLAPLDRQPVVDSAPRRSC